MKKETEDMLKHDKNHRDKKEKKKEQENRKAARSMKRVFLSD